MELAPNPIQAAALAPAGVASDAHARKINDIGTRIASVAHEINVPLSLIRGSLDTLSQYVDTLVHFIQATADTMLQNRELAALHAELNLPYVTSNTLPLLDICREGTTRLGHVVQQLRLYTRRTGEDGTAPVDLRQLLSDACYLASLERSQLPCIRFQVQQLPRIEGHAESLSRAMVNLVHNSIDAVGQRVDGEVVIEASPCESVDGTAPAAIEIRIRDNGPGVAAADRARIFEPFFSTKPHTSGLGLGLAITREIIEQHGGSVTVADTAEPGACFVVRLPIATAPL